MKNFIIKGFGKYIPDNYCSNDELSKFVDTSDEWITSRTGIKTRAFAIDENTSHICTKAGLDVLKNANVDPMEIDIVIVATMSPDYVTPSVATVVANNIGAFNAFAFDISAACTGFVYAMSVAHKFLASGMYKNVLVIGGEVISKNIDFTDRGTCVIFGDGGGGVLLQATDQKKMYQEELHCDGALSHTLTALPMPNRNFCSNTKDDEHGKYLEMDGRAILNFVLKKVPKNIQNVLIKEGISMEDIDYCVPHQANARIIDSLAKKLNMPIEKMYVNIQKYGNTSAASIPIALCEMNEEGLLKENTKLLLTGFGAGLTWGTILLEI